MTIAFRSAGTVSWGTGGGNSTPGIPSGYQPGDFFAYITYTGNGAANVPSGYSLYAEHNTEKMTFGGTMAVGSMSSPTFTFAGGSVDDGSVLVGFSGTATISSSANLDNQASTYTSSGVSSSSGLPYPSLTPNTNNCALVMLVGMTYSFTPSTPVGWTSAFTSSNSPVDGYAICGFYQIQTTATTITAGNIALAGAGTGQAGVVFMASIPVAASSSSNQAMLMGMC